MSSAREPRVLFSSEALADADDDAIRRIAEDVGDGVRVLVTLRPIDVILASQWQQSVQSGSVQPLEEWLRRMVGDLDSAAENHPRAHRVFRQGELVDRWAAVVGRDRVTVVVLDRRDPGFLFRTAEALLAVRSGTLSPDDDQSNRSLSLGEVEGIRHMNVLAREAGIGDGARAAFVMSGAAATVKRRPVAATGGRVRCPRGRRPAPSSWARRPSTGSPSRGSASSAIRRPWSRRHPWPWTPGRASTGWGRRGGVGRRRDGRHDGDGRRMGNGPASLDPISRSRRATSR